MQRLNLKLIFNITFLNLLAPMSMAQYQKLTLLFFLTVFSSLSNAQSDVNPVPEITNDWRFSVTPYVWAPGIMATLNMNNNAVNTADYSTSNVLSNLKSGAMMAGEAHKGKWGIMADTFFATLQHGGSFTARDKSGNLRIGDSVTLQETILTGAALYNVHNSSDASVDGLLGVRAIYSTASMKLNVIGTSLKENSSTTMSTIDPIAGFKGRYRIAGSSWYVPFYADIGGGGGTTSLTWQAMLGVGKSINRLIDVSASYRALYYDMHGAGLLMKTTMQGPQIAVTFNF